MIYLESGLTYPKYECLQFMLWLLGHYTTTKLKPGVESTTNWPHLIFLSCQNIWTNSREPNIQVLTCKTQNEKKIQLFGTIWTLLVRLAFIAFIVLRCLDRQKLPRHWHGSSEELEQKIKVFVSSCWPEYTKMILKAKNQKTLFSSFAVELIGSFSRWENVQDLESKGQIFTDIGGSEQIT